MGHESPVTSMPHVTPLKFRFVWAVRRLADIRPRSSHGLAGVGGACLAGLGVESWEAGVAGRCAVKY